MGRTIETPLIDTCVLRWYFLVHQQLYTMLPIVVLCWGIMSNSEKAWALWEAFDAQWQAKKLNKAKHKNVFQEFCQSIQGNGMFDLLIIC